MSYDHVITGAGVIGSAAAYHLKRIDPGSEILLIDMGSRPGEGNTARSAALYRNIFSSRTSKLLSASSISYYRELGHEVQLNPMGYLWMFSRDQWGRSKSSIETLDPERDEVDFPGREEISDMLRIDPDGIGSFPGIHRGIKGRMCGSLSGMGLAQHYADRFKELGGELLFDSRVERIELGGSVINGKRARSLILESGERIMGEDFLFATGAWTHDLLSGIGIFTGVLPKKRQLFGIKLDDVEQITDRDSLPAMILPAGGVYIKPLLKGKMIFVGLADDLGRPYSLEDSDPEINFFRTDIEPVLNHYFPHLADYELRSSWAGHYSNHWPDKNPVVENISNIYWSGGTSGSGIMKADAIGRITADKLLGNGTSVLFDGSSFRVSDLSLRERDVEPESFVI